MKKIHILDTSVLIDNPYAYKNFPDSEVVIPAAVLDELDKKKTQASGASKNARVCIRGIEEITSKGNVAKGILLEDNILFKIDPEYFDANSKAFKGFGDPNYGDTQILISAFVYQKDHPEDEIILVSNDINLRAKARTRGLKAESFDRDLSADDLYSGNRIIENEMAGMALQQEGMISMADYNIELYPNECVMFVNEIGDGIALGRRVSQDKIKLIKKVYPWSLSSRNKEQTYAIDVLMDKEIDLVTFTGPAGTGKSLVTMAGALELVLNKKVYDKLIVYRPIQAVGADVGFLPGELSEKLAPWFQSVMDAFEFLFTAKHGGDWKKDLEIYQKKGKISLETMTYIRGRSIQNALIVIEECQNLTKEDVKTILTRAGTGTKIIALGDIQQIDAKSLSAVDNGLTYMIEKFKESDLAAHVTLEQGERSRLATLASEIL